MCLVCRLSYRLASKFYLTNQPSFWAFPALSQAHNPIKHSPSGLPIVFEHRNCVYLNVLSKKAGIDFSDSCLGLPNLGIPWRQTSGSERQSSSSCWSFPTTSKQLARCLFSTTSILRCMKSTKLCIYSEQFGCRCILSIHFTQAFSQSLSTNIRYNAPARMTPIN